MTPIARPLSPFRRCLVAVVHGLPANVLSRPWLRRMLVALQLPGPADAEPPPPPECIDDDRPRGCGWFDSSLDLQQGLRVQEHTGLPGSDPALADLPLAAWLELQLHGWRAELAEAPAAPGFTPAT